MVTLWSFYIICALCQSQGRYRPNVVLSHFVTSWNLHFVTHCHIIFLALSHFVTLFLVIFTHYVTPFSVILAHFDTIFVTATSLSDWGKSKGIFHCPSGAHIYRETSVHTSTWNFVFGGGKTCILGAIYPQNPILSHKSHFVTLF